MARISQQAAQDAAKKITEKISAEIAELDLAIRKAASEAYSNRIPKEVKECYAKYPAHFHASSTVRLEGNGFNRNHIVLDKEYPSNDYYFTPTKEESKEIATLINKKGKLQEHLATTRKEIEATILSLCTHKRVETEFPEAFPYISGAPSTTTMIVAIKPIRDKVKKLVA